VQFLDGLISNDMKTLADGEQMLAAFPNAQGRLIAVVRVLRHGDRFFFETEDATREKLFQNLLRFTFAGDFFVEDLSESHKYFEVFNVSEPPASAGGFTFGSHDSSDRFVPIDAAADFREKLIDLGAVQIAEALYETLRIENGAPKYGVDMNETTIVPELGLEELISYTKGCYIGQEIIARIHFRGHVAKQLAGLILSEPAATGLPVDLATPDGKNAGRITSATFSPKLGKTIALGYVRHDFLSAGTELKAGDVETTVANLPFV
jgi:tRNA-modifying protein YgfZ